MKIHACDYTDFRELNQAVGESADETVDISAAESAEKKYKSPERREMRWARILTEEQSV